VVKEVKWVKKALEKAEEAARRLGASGVWIYEACLTCGGRRMRRGTPW